MTRSQFFQHFDLLADQRDAVAKMREFVFQLAIQGRLGPQEIGDEPVSKLLERIRNALAAGEHETRRGKAKKNGASQEKPFEVPPTWDWVRFGDVVRIRTGNLDANAAVADGKYPFFTCSQTPSRIDSYPSTGREYTPSSPR